MKRFQQAISKPYGYLVVDLKSGTQEQDRLRTGIFSKPSKRKLADDDEPHSDVVSKKVTVEDDDAIDDTGNDSDGDDDSDDDSNEIDNDDGNKDVRFEAAAHVWDNHNMKKRRQQRKEKRGTPYQNSRRKMLN
ncbi:hypothetical protein ACF0H5_016196 [Mactra antiquata]